MSKKIPVYLNEKEIRKIINCVDYYQEMLYEGIAQPEYEKINDILREILEQEKELYLDKE